MDGDRSASDGSTGEVPKGTESVGPGAGFFECASCGARGTGNYCAQCGASLRPGPCGSCGSLPPPGATFCTECGTGLGKGAPVAGSAQAPGADARSVGGTSPFGGNAGWLIAGALLLGIVLMVGLPALRGGGPSAPNAGGPAPQAPPPGGSSVDLSTMTPREAADRLFNRVVGAYEAGDSTEVLSFLPMAIAAYERAAPLDHDGTFHLSILLRVGLDFEAALAAAEAVLAEAPEHLLALNAAAEAARERGDRELAGRYFQRFLDAYDDERVRDLLEYQVHAALLPEMKADAEAFLGGG